MRHIRCRLKREVHVEIHRVLRPGGLNVYTARNTNDPDFGVGIHRGEDLYEDGGFVVHFFNREKVKRLADGYELIDLEEFEEGALPKRLFLVTLRRSITSLDKRANHDRESSDLFEQSRSLYSDLALHPEKDFGWRKGKENARQLGDDRCWLERFPATVWESAAAVGNPFSLGPIHPGETVVDFGCGPGADLCIAALLAGPTGHVIGVDLTPAMVQKARANAVRARLANVTVYEADIANVPLPDACADAVISNGAINLLPEKPYALREAFRVLKLGGRLQTADMILDESAPQCERVAAGSWANCVAGTVAASCFLQMLAQFGFARAACVKTNGYRTSMATIGAHFFC